MLLDFYIIKMIPCLSFASVLCYGSVRTYRYAQDLAWVLS